MQLNDIWPPPGIKQVDEHLKGWPDHTLSVLLIVVAVVLVVVAIKGDATMKAIFAAWVLMP